MGEIEEEGKDEEWRREIERERGGEREKKEREREIGPHYSSRQGLLK